MHVMIGRPGRPEPFLSRTRPGREVGPRGVLNLARCGDDMMPKMLEHAWAMIRQLNSLEVVVSEIG